MKKILILPAMCLMFCMFLPMAKADIVLEKKDLKDITTMEKRHYKNSADDFDSNEYRLNRLETTFFGETFEEMDTKERMRRLRIASQKMFMEGMSKPVKIKSRYINAGDDVIQIVDHDNIGIIDGFLKLWAPELYAKVQEKNEILMRSGY